ncbi:M56 family metallopeptidase [Aquisphaera insulae]|uniref:M56 family metallopeptidase n=1 Tax=Aquisphaera insulae TaxID=2712864 RepID=UPI0013ED6470|nr:M56 family metallopeptidase [Aquisphaera insulae]
MTGFDLLWRASWQAGILVLAVVLIRALLGKRLTAAMRYALWGVVLARLLLPVLPQSPASAYGLFDVKPRESPPMDVLESPRIEPPAQAEPVAIPEPSPVSRRAEVPVEQDAPAKPAAVQPARSWTWWQAAAVAWVLGVSLVAFRALRSLVLLARRSRHWVAADDPQLAALFESCRVRIGLGWRPVLKVSEDGFGPAAMGVIRPAILIPRSILESTSRGNLEHILLHELSHLRRRDAAVDWLWTIACAVHWFNPVAWWAAARARTDRELACDASVLDRLGPGRRGAYGMTVLDLTVRRDAHPLIIGTVGAFGSQRHLSERIDMIAEHVPPRRGRRFASLAVLLGLAAVGLTDAAPAGSTPEPAEAQEPAKAEPVPEALAKRVAELVAQSRPTNASEPEKWAPAIRELTRIGRPAVPLLIDELDRTTDERMLRSLGFTLRAIGDPRAIPALIRAIPRTLVNAGSDYGIALKDPELFAFMRKHDNDTKDVDKNNFTLNTPFREITGALRSLTGQRFHEDELNFVTPGGNDLQRAIKERQYHRLARRWADWWEVNWLKFTDDRRYASVRLPSLPDEHAEVRPADQPFPTGPAVHGDTTRANIILGPPQPLEYYRTFEDLDSGRMTTWPGELGDPVAPKPGAIEAWAADQGIDLQGTHYRIPGDDRVHFGLKPLGLRAWEIDNDRFDRMEQELKAGPPKLGRPVTDWLMHYDEATKTYDPDATATFLFATREGGTGILQVTGQIRDLLRPEDIGQPVSETRKRGFYRGVQFRMRFFTDSPPDGGE